MPINYQVRADGHVIEAVAHGKVTGEEFVAFEIAHAIDPRVQPPVREILEVEPGALEAIRHSDMERILEERRRIPQKPTPHSCAIIISYHDTHAWALAKFYEGMVILHSPESVIVFGEKRLAKLWLGIEDEKN